MFGADPGRQGAARGGEPGPASSSPSPTKLTAEQEVEAAVRNYYAELTRAAQTNDTTKLKTLMAKSCPCYGAARSIDQVADDGGSTPGAEWTVLAVNVNEVIEDYGSAEVKYELGSYEALGADGRTVRKFPARKFHFDLTLVRMKGRWIITNVFDLEGG